MGRINLNRVNVDPTVRQPYMVINSWVVPEGDITYKEGLRLGLLAGMAAFMRVNSAVVALTSLAVFEQTDYGVMIKDYVWDYGRGLDYHSPTQPNIINPTHGTAVIRLRTRDNAPGTFYQAHYLPNATNSYLRGIMEGVASFQIDQAEVFYYE